MGANLGVSAGSVVIPSAANLASWRAFWRVSSSVSSSNCSASDCSAFEFTMGTFVNLGSTAARLSWTPLLSFGTRPLEECFLEDSNVAASAAALRTAFVEATSDVRTLREQNRASVGGGCSVLRQVGRCGEDRNALLPHRADARRSCCALVRARRCGQVNASAVLRTVTAALAADPLPEGGRGCRY